MTEIIKALGKLCPNFYAFLQQQQKENYPLTKKPFAFA